MRSGIPIDPMLTLILFMSRMITCSQLFRNVPLWLKMLDAETALLLEEDNG
jgi:hypothetical protein